MKKLEVCTGSIASALNAQNAGADRIELCTELSVGGLTPSHGMIKVAKDMVDLPIYVLIRPRSGDFVFDLLELEQMKDDIQFCVEQQIDGVVIGALNKERKINETMMKELMDVAGYMDVTFHRAFDQVANPFEALDTLIELGVQRVLTSGGKGKASDNIEQLAALQDEAGDELIIMPGGGIRSANVNEFSAHGFKEIHSSCLISGELHSNIDEIRKLQSIFKADV